MPLYSFKNKKTGKMWDEILSFKEREELLKDKNIEQIITAPMGIRKSPDWLKERTEKHLQKVRNVSS